MWFVFPQLRELGRSQTARHFGIASLDEARAYLAHPLLGPRLHEATGCLLQAPPALDAHTILGSPDDLKLASSMTLFREADPATPRWQAMLDRFHGGRADPQTLALLGRTAP
jgi:uncharacterized protein (DUF1810 family)